MAPKACQLCGKIFNRTKPKSNTLYCSDSCRKQVKMERDRVARAKYRAEMALLKKEQPVKKLLPCLACEKKFMTTIDKRICKDCKNDNGRRHKLNCYRILGPREAI